MSEYKYSFGMVLSTTFGTAFVMGGDS
ncbi:unnamed protein product [Ectocarpus sp. CCAP 1310/34]|nr:unnamed protein product [Ectocarpus sp. CCAP 1310/34]